MPRNAPRNRVHQSLARLLLERHPEDAARIFESAPLEEVAALLEKETPARTAEVLRRLTPDIAASVLALLSPELGRHVLTSLDPNRAAALLARLDAERREQSLVGLDAALARELRELMEYPPDSAGRLMDPRIITFRPDSRARDAAKRLRGLRGQRIQDVYLVDEEGRFAGAVALQELVLAGPDERLSDLVREGSPAVPATLPREEVLDAFRRHRVGTVPVTDFEGRPIGVVHQKELIGAALRNATADMVMMTGASQEERALSSPFFAVRKRLPWLQINLATAFLAASVVGLFEETIARFTALAVLLPVVAGQSGNTGAQALAVTMRGLALREVRVRQWFRVMLKEVSAGAMNGVAVALTTSVAVYFWSSSTGLALVIGVSMVLSMAAAGLAGAVIPMALTALRQDPAQSSSIVLTTVTDVAGFFSFLGIATLLASML